MSEKNCALTRTSDKKACRWRAGREGEAARQDLAGRPRRAG